MVFPARDPCAKRSAPGSASRDTTAVKRVLEHYKVKSILHGVAHITGGGLAENLERILPPHVDVRISTAAWQVPELFRWLQRLGEIDDHEMRRVFNMGLGLVLVVSPFYANQVGRIVTDAGFECHEIGQVVAGSGKVRLESAAN